MGEQLLSGIPVRVCVSKLIATVALILLAAILPVFAQLPTGTILGVVRDSTGGSVPDAQVTLTNVDTGIARTATTGSDGEYRVVALQPGHYSVKVEKSGFKTETQAGITLDVAAEVTVNAALEIGSSSQEVTVTGEAPLVETTTSSLGGLVNDAKIADLPLNGRNFVDLAVLQPGVTNDTNFQNSQGSGGNWGVLFSSNGAPIRSNTFTLDGAVMMDGHGNVSSAIGATLGVDGIKEYKVITNAFPAEYGLQMGSQVVIVSKGGTNQWHGDVFDYLRNNILDARNFFDYSYITSGDRIPELQRNNFGGSFGGPIKKDKTFFYAVYEGLRLNQAASIIDNVFPADCHPGYPGYNAAANPCATAATVPANTTVTPNIPAVPKGSVAPWILPILALYPSPNLPGTNNFYFAPVNPSTENYGQIRVDHNFSASDSMFGRFTIAPSSNITSGLYPGTALVTSGQDQFLTLAENHIFSPTVLNSFRVSYSRTNIRTSDNFSPNLDQPQYSIVEGQPMGSLTITGVAKFGPSTPNLFLQNIYTLSDDVYYTKGKHSFKFGTLINRIEDSVFTTTNLYGNSTFTSEANFLAGIYSNVTAITPGSDTSKGTRYYTAGFYAQDDWRVASRLTLNLGLRYEFNTNVLDNSGRDYAFRPTVAAGGPNTVQGALFQDPSYKNFSPRVGFAWDIFGNGKTSIRSAFGEYYDITEYGFIVYTGEQATPPLSSLLQITTPKVAQTLPLIVPGLAVGNSLDTQQYAINQPKLLQWNFSIEQQLTPSTVLTVSYVGTRGIHLWDRQEGNPCVPTAIVNGIPDWLTNGVAGTDCPVSPLNPGNTVNGRANKFWGSANYEETNSDSWYNGLQASLTKRLGHGVEVQGAYTYSKVLDDTQGEFGPSDCNAVGSADGTYPEDAKVFDKGPACFNTTQNLRVNVLYHVPNLKMDNRFANSAINGWWVGSIISWQTGFPFSPVLGSEQSLSDDMGTKGNDYASINTMTVAPGQTGMYGNVNTTAATTWIPYNPKTVITGNPQQWFNPLMFIPGPVGFLGTAGRDILEGPHLSNIDFTVSKDTRAPFLGEQGQVEFRADFFNILNHANFGVPTTTTAAYSGFPTVPTTSVYGQLPSSSAGQITYTATTSRQIQVSLKLIF